MAVAVDAVNTGSIQFNQVTSFSATPLTITASGTAALASIIFEENNGTTQPSGVSITWNSVAMSIVPGADTGVIASIAHDIRAVLYGLASPATGSHTFAGSWTNAYAGYCEIMSWKGTDTTTPFKNGVNASGTSAAPSITVNSPTNDFAVGCLAEGGENGASLTPNQTSWWADTGGSRGAGGANYTAGASASTSLTTTLSVSETWAYAACDVQVPIVASGGTQVAKQNFKVNKFKTPLRSMGPNAGLFQVRAFPISAPFVDVPLSYVSRPFSTQWNLNSNLLRGTAQDTSSSAVETNPHWKGCQWPAQWSDTGAFLLNAAIDVPPAIDAPPSFMSKSWSIQWNINLSLRRNTAQDFSSSAVETNPHWIGNYLPSKWDLNRALRLNIAQDFSSSVAETNPQWTGKPWPRVWNLLEALWQNAAIDVPTVTVADTPPSFVPLQFSSQWNVDVSLVHGAGIDAATISVVETNTHFISRQFIAQWNFNRALGRSTAQDTSSSAVETNIHFVPHTWPVPWIPAASLRQNVATDAPTVVPPDAPTYFIPGQLPWNWVINLLLTTSPANDLTSPAVETNPHRAGLIYPKQWQTQPSLWQNPATDAPPVVDTPSYFISKQLLLQWNLNRVLGRNIAADFSSSAVETNVYFTPHVWPLRWDLQASLTRGTAQDFSSVAPVVTSRPRVYIYT